MSLKISNLSKRYDDKWVLRDVSLEVEPGEILGLFGASRAGKTAFINALAGKEKINGGSIFYNSEDVTKLTCEDRKFHFPSLSNASIWKSLFKTDTASQLADGEGQVLALEAALEDADGVLLLDNSFCDMDKNMRLENFEKLRRVVREKNLTVIFATNDYDEVFLTCDRVAVLAGGEIRQTGTPEEVYEKPTSVAVAEILGRNNLFSARRLTSSKAELPEFQTIEGEHRLFAQKADIKSLGAINQNVMLAIRPEHISISFGASFPEDNLLKALITGVRFLGPTTLIELDSNGLKLEALVLRLVGLKTGDECVIGLPPDRILILKN